MPPQGLSWQLHVSPAMTAQLRQPLRCTDSMPSAWKFSIQHTKPPTDLYTLAIYTPHPLQVEGSSVLWATGQTEQAADQQVPQYPSPCRVLYFYWHSQKESGLKSLSYTFYQLVKL